MFAHGTDQVFAEWFCSVCKPSLRRRPHIGHYVGIALLTFERQWLKNEEMVYQLSADKTKSGQVETYRPEDPDEDFDSELARPDDEW